MIRLMLHKIKVGYQNVIISDGPKKQKKKAEKFLQKDHTDSNMLVAIRIRPLSQKEIANSDKDIIRSEDKLLGYNGCIFAYGTTGSGKTHTMTGNPDCPGIMYLIIKDMFDKIQNETEKKFEIKVSYVEIYNEVIRDLLVANSKDTYLDLRDDSEKGVQLAGVTEFQVQEPNQVMSLLQIGNKRRSTEATNANQTSSRSHAICQIQLSVKDKLSNTENEVLCGKLSLIDLAGSERGTVTENRGIRLREGAKINTSLLALANCINALGDKTKKGFFVPFRDSKLTRMLKDSLGGNCKTVMIATISPSSNQNEETINTLKYANRAKNIKMRVEPNKKMVYQHISAYKSIIADLRDEIDKLKAQLHTELGQRNNPLSITKTSKDIESIQKMELEEAKQKTQPLQQVQSLIKNADCKCDSRLRDQIRQLEDVEEEIKNSKENMGEQNNNENQPSNEVAFLNRHIQQHQQQIEILSESTKQNLIKRQQMKQELYENYQQIKSIRLSIDQRIENNDIKDYLELVIKNNFLESQNVQLLLNLQLQARTIMDLKNMIQKQQKFIEDNDIGGNSINGDKNMDLFLDGGELDFEDQDALEEQYISDFNEDKQNIPITNEQSQSQNQNRPPNGGGSIVPKKQNLMVQKQAKKQDSAKIYSANAGTKNKDTSKNTGPKKR
ncbi:kinesin heavy chain [Stylonychia lemnae]|uniref:Kinesin-like protein n=1 Tax=Stylonychia lemnae TaxID=5949 RepID=A0A077ZY72_STYLE|nr:kinesin heavy chain [Stylonychia lemnae]|eukprot:CDW74177.1 kinesin heavy chain [Stylonychia lemnae]